jgi:hypothetical protein
LPKKRGATEERVSPVVNIYPNGFINSKKKRVYTLVLIYTRYGIICKKKGATYIRES